MYFYYKFNTNNSFKIWFIIVAENILTFLSFIMAVLKCPLLDPIFEENEWNLEALSKNTSNGVSCFSVSIIES